MNRVARTALFLGVFAGAAAGTAAITAARRPSHAWQAPFQIGGRLIEEETGLPLAGRVIASQLLESGGAAVTPVTVDEDGDFVFRGLSDGPVTLIGVAEGHGRTVLVETVDASNIRELEIALPRAITIRGRVVSALGQPVAGAQLTVKYADRVGRRVHRESLNLKPLLFYEGSWEGSRADFSVGPGSFILNGVEPFRPFEILAEHPIFGTGTFESPTPYTSLRAGSAIDGVELVLR